MKKKPELMLYYKDTCPYCKKVFNYLEDLHKTIPFKNIKGDTEYTNELIQFGGKKQVPCLVIDGQALYESDAIILWIEEHKSFLDDADSSLRL